MADRLDVYWEDSLAGRLLVDEKSDFLFQYDPGWLEGNKGIPLSVRLPLQKEPFGDNTARTFFANLLPEGDVRATIAALHKISPGNSFKLLEILGGECAGAIALIPEGTRPDLGGSYIPLSWEELDRMIDQMPQSPLLTARGELRLSLAGAQHKLPVFVPRSAGTGPVEPRRGAGKGRELYLPKGSYASSHILKPQIERFKNTVENEGFCMALAKECGLPVAEAAIWKEGRYAVLLVERYDRQAGKGDTPIRLHQEDFCQALGFSYERKYESEGGPRLQDCFALLDAKSSQPVMDKKNLLNWAIFNYLIGNCDAHAKNLSLLIRREGFRLAPFYDLLCTVVYERLDKELAMQIGGEANLGNIMKKQWERLADDAGVGVKAVFNYGQEMAGKLPALSQSLAGKWIRDHGARWVIEGISKHIAKYSGRLIKALKQSY